MTRPRGASRGPAPGVWTSACRVLTFSPEVRALCVVLAAILLLRVPSFFEPPWHSDEGIFAAVAQRVLQGGALYADAWESKPPFFLLTYVGLFGIFEPGVFPLRLASTAACLATAIALYAVARQMLGARRALIAPAIAGVLLSVPFWEGTLALTEIFTVLPTTLAVLCLLAADRRMEAGSSWRRWLLLSGLLFAVAFLFRQTAAAVGVVAVAWLVLRGRPWLSGGLLLAAGFAAAVAPVVAAFALLGSFQWFWDANVGFFFRYVPSGQELPFAARPVIVLPFLAALGCMLWYRRRGPVPAWGLAALWLSVALAGAMLTGRPYSHYMLQMFPPLGLLAAFVLPHARPGWRPARAHAAAYALTASLALTWAYVVTPMFQGNPFAMHFTRGPDYYANFAGRALGLRDQRQYEDFFDRRVQLTWRLREVLGELGARGERAYIWGEYPWVYPLARVEPASRYMTSFYLLLLPNENTRLGATLDQRRPRYIVLLDDANPKCGGCSPDIDRRHASARKALDAMTMRDYDTVAIVGKATVFRRSPPRPIAGLLVEPAHYDEEGP